VVPEEEEAKEGTAAAAMGAAVVRAAVAAERVETEWTLVPMQPEAPSVAPAVAGPVELAAEGHLVNRWTSASQVCPHRSALNRWRPR
jgi:hypothetical protein